MAKIEISVTRKGKGIDVQCRMIKDDSDSELVKKAARLFWFHSAVLSIQF
jgi:hypothetical protein